jgi:hypothetical protein
MKVTIECDKLGVKATSEDTEVETWGEVTELFLRALKGFGYNFTFSSDDVIGYMHTLHEEALKRNQ